MRSITRLSSSLLAPLLPIVLASAPALAATGGEFHEGDLYVVSQSLGGFPTSTSGIARVDAASGVTVPILVTGTVTRLATFDPFRRKLVVGIGPVGADPFGVYFVDADGSKTLSPIPAAASFASPAGDGRIYFFQANGTATKTLRYLDAANTVHDVLNVAGTGPLTYTSTATDADLLFEPSTHSLWIATNQSGTACGWAFGIVASIARIPLDAAGMQATGVVQSFPVCLPVVNPGFDSYVPERLSLGPAGKVMCVVDMNGAASPFPNVAVIDPATMAASAYCTTNYPGNPAINSGVYSTTLNAAIVLDTGTDTLRAFIAGSTGAGVVLSNSGVSSAGGSAEITTLVGVTGSSTGLANYGTGTAGCAGAEVLTTNQSPKVNAVDFRFLSTNAPASSLGLLLVADAADAAGTDVFGLGILLHVNLFTATQVYGFDMNSNAIGLGTSAPIPLLPGLAGLTLYGQGLWFWSTCTPPSGTGLSTTNGLAFTVQP